MPLAVILGNPKHPQARAMAERLAGVCRAAGWDAWVEKDLTAPGPTGEITEALDRCQLVVVLGGDGTFIRAVRLLDRREVPLFGVNLGQLGYLTEFTVDEAAPELERVLAGNFRTQRRSRLRVRLLRGRECPLDCLVLNDVVVNSVGMSRIIEMGARVDGNPVTTYRADGLIVATPTGSTAYSLSAGGPILMPQMQAMLLTPICPHTLTMRPLVLPAAAKIELSVARHSDGVQATLDGQRSEAILPGDIILVEQAAEGVLLVEPRRDTFQILHAKLRWGER